MQWNIFKLLCITKQDAVTRAGMKEKYAMFMPHEPGIGGSFPELFVSVRFTGLFPSPVSSTLTFSNYAWATSMRHLQSELEGWCV